MPVQVALDDCRYVRSLRTGELLPGGTDAQVLREAPVTPEADPAPAARPPHALMVVEDDADIRRLLRLQLARDDRLDLGPSFGNALDALSAVRTSCPDVILCDVGLPGMSGLEALPPMRDACPDAVIVIYTANPEGSLDALALGADAVVGKDTDLTRLFDHVVELLGQRA